MSANGNAQRNLLNTRQMTSAREMNAFKRAKAIKDAGIRCVVPPPKPKPDFKDVEFSLPDEERSFALNYFTPCPQCGVGMAELVRQGSLLGQEFTVRCNLVSCGYETPPMKSSQLAIRHWKLVAALSK